MVWSWFNSDKASSLVEIFRRVGEFGISCLFSCFRVREYQTLPQSESKNALSSLFVSDDESVGKSEKGCDSRTGELDFSELKNEAKFLKACGTLPETPEEIRKGSVNWENISDESGEKISLELTPKKHFDEYPTPFKIGEQLSMEEGSLDQTPSSCMTEGNNTRSGSVSSVLSSDKKNFKSAVTCDSARSSATSSVSPIVFVPQTERKIKSVRFESEPNGFEFSTKSFSSESASEGSKPSPNPTPLKLTFEMQTPGTVFPADMTIGKPARIRAQYIYAVQNPFENNSEWKGLKAEISDSDQQRESNTVLEKVSDGKEMKNEASLSVNKQDGDSGSFGSNFGEDLVCGRTPGDRPILGMVAAHWMHDESTNSSPTVWDGNGIPNSTTKYKEDQKVSWHATPFEERLEKALSGRTFVSHSQRKSILGTPPAEFDETEEECDAASEHLQPSTNLSSVVSS